MRKRHIRPMYRTTVYQKPAPSIIDATFLTSISSADFLSTIVQCTQKKIAGTKKKHG